MEKRKRRMTGKELERWLLKKGAVPITEEMKKEPWYEEMSKLPSCFTDHVVIPAKSAGCSV